jgi:hypothetical protein
MYMCINATHRLERGHDGCWWQQSIGPETALV